MSLASRHVHGMSQTVVTLAGGNRAAFCCLLFRLLNGGSNSAVQEALNVQHLAVQLVHKAQYPPVPSFVPKYPPSICIELQTPSACA